MRPPRACWSRVRCVLLLGAGVRPLAVQRAAGDGWYQVDIQVAPTRRGRAVGLSLPATGRRRAWERTRRRNRIELAGIMVLTYTWWDVVHDGARRVVREISRTLGHVRASVAS